MHADSRFSMTIQIIFLKTNSSWRKKEYQNNSKSELQIEGPVARIQTNRYEGHLYYANTCLKRQKSQISKADYQHKLTCFKQELAFGKHFKLAPLLGLTIIDKSVIIFLILK